MAIPFVRSTRALHTDRERPALIILAIALLLLVLRGAWFFWAPITLYETGQLVGATRRGTLVATFSTQAAARLQPGQMALLRPEGALAKPVKAIPAMVMDVGTKVVNGQMQIELSALADQEQNNDLVNHPKGQVVVEVEQVSPAIVMWRTSVHWVDTTSVLLSPQTR